MVGDAAVLSLLFPVEVALKVGLVHAVETEIVEHGVHLGLTGIVAGAHGVHIGLLHQLDVLKHGGHVNCAAVYGVGVLGVGALEEDSLAVDIDLAVLDFNLAEAHLRAERHLFLLAVLLDDLEGVEVGRFGSPELEVLEVVEGEGQSLARFVGREGEGLVLCGDFLTCGREQAQEDVLLAAQGCAVVEGEGHLQVTALIVVVLVQAGLDVVVAHENLRRGIEINVAVDAAHVPHILAFEIRAIAPADDLHADIVRARANLRGYFKLCIVVAALRVADILSVDPYEGGAVDAIKVEEDAVAVPRLRQVEVAAIGSHGVLKPVLHFDGGRRIVEGVVHIDVERVAVSLHL